MTEFVFVVPLGGLVVLVFLYLRRLADGPAATAWGGAWLAVYGAGLISTLDQPPAEVRALGTVLGSLFPGLLLAGSLGVHRGRFAAWPIGFALAIGLTRLALLSAGRPDLAIAVEIPCELPLTLAAAALAWRNAFASRSLPEQLLGPTLLLLALLNVADPLARLLDLATLPIILGWIGTTLAAGLCQVGVLVERDRARDRRLAAESNLLYRVARLAASEPHDLRAALDAILHAFATLARVDGIGVWLIDESGRHLDVAARLRRADEPPDTTLRLPLDDPIAQLALDGGEAVRVIDPRAHGEALRRRADRLRMGEVALAPLCAGERKLGVLVAGIGLGRRFDAENLRLVQRLAEEITQVAVHTRELQERAREAGLRDAERRTLRALVEAAPVGIFVIDDEGDLRSISRSGAEQLGIDPEAWTGRPARALLDHIATRLAPGEARRLQTRLAWDPGDLQGLELRFTQPEERVLELGVRTVRSEDRKRLGQLWVSRDVTEERRLAGRLGWVRRLERLGALAGSVALELHEQTGAIRAAARQLLDAAGSGPPPALVELARAAERSSERARQLLELARPARPAVAAVDVEALLRELLERLRATRPARLQIDLVLATGLRPAHADREQLKRILETLAGHACDAAGRRGTVTLAARNAEPMPGEPPRLVIEVRESGGALDPSLLEQILDPSLATRPDVKGPGLELAVAVSLAEAQGAAVEVESLPGRGSVFRLRWPAATARTQAARRRPSPAARAQATPQRDGGARQAAEASPEPREAAGALVLLAEDEAAVRRLARIGLERAGFRVAEAEDGDAAVALFERLHAEVALAVVDLSMPRRDGIAALHAMRTLAPDLPAVVITGGSGPGPDDAWPADARVLTKPFTPDELAEVVRARLAARAPGEAPGPEPPARAG